MATWFFQIGLVLIVGPLSLSVLIREPILLWLVPIGAGSWILVMLMLVARVLFPVDETDVDRRGSAQQFLEQWNVRTFTRGSSTAECRVSKFELRFEAATLSADRLAEFSAEFINDSAPVRALP